MIELFDKRDRATQFRQRLNTALITAGQTQAGLARAIGVDRSTISQLLRDDGARLPNGQVVAECARVLGVSADWLLGLTELEGQAADVMAQALTLTDAPRALIDETVFQWHQEAAGYKIRHVPAGLPDMIKTRAMLEWEYAPALGRTTEQAILASEDRLNWMAGAGSDYEIAMPVHDIAAFAAGVGYYAGCPRQVRLDQLHHMMDLYDRLYPSLRVHLFNARQLFSAPVTVFGPKIAAVYLGQKYMVFRDIDRVKAMTRHFDDLIKQADIGSRDWPDHIRKIAATV